MKRPVYKKYDIYYGGKYMEQISATSKKNVLEYIKDTYKGKWDAKLDYKYYKLRLFEVRLIEPKN